jgi:hypothetical protein
MCRVAFELCSLEFILCPIVGGHEDPVSCAENTIRVASLQSDQAVTQSLESIFLRNRSASFQLHDGDSAILHALESPAWLDFQAWKELSLHRRRYHNHTCTCRSTVKPRRDKAESLGTQRTPRPANGEAFVLL